jgi:glycopeptide antibiotics resistance protein
MRVNSTSNKLHSNKYVKAIFIFYILLLLKMSFWGFGTFPIRLYGEYSNVSTNFTPFKSIINYLVNFEHYNFGIWFYNTFGNIILFLPLGILITSVFLNVKYFIQVFYLSFFVSLGIELIQYLTKLGVFDVDDIILNITGSLIGFSILSLVRKIKK